MPHAAVVRNYGADALISLRENSILTVTYVEAAAPSGNAMRPSEALEANRDFIRQVVASHRAGNPRIFGSVLRGQDTGDSDLDILIDPAADMTLFDICAIRHELTKLLGVQVDVATPNALPDRFRAQILSEAVPV